MKKLKKFFICFLCLFLFSIEIAPIYAFNTDIEISDTFIDFCNDMFENKDKTTILNYNNENITENFFKTNISYYESKKYNLIKKYVNENVSKMWIEQLDFNLLTRAPFVTNTVSKRVYEAVNKQQASGEIVYFLEGSFVWDRATNKITSKSNGNIRLSKVDFGNNWSYDVYSMSTNSTLSGNNTKITFSGHFSMRVKYTPGVFEVWNIDLGQFSTSVSATPHD